jgi:hypothetical protein
VVLQREGQQRVQEQVQLRPVVGQEPILPQEAVVVRRHWPSTKGGLVAQYRPYPSFWRYAHLRLFRRTLCSFVKILSVWITIIQTWDMTYGLF